jgi:ribosome-binding protein aMBF1 (putative translation factor)
MPKKQETPSHLLKHSATVLLGARMSSGISQRELSRRINVTQPLISSWEQGKALPTITHIVSIEKSLAVESGTLLLAIAYGSQQEE